MGIERYFKKVNRQLLPVKVHYFLFLTALACALPFRTIFAKQLGLSATAVGVIFFAVPFMRILSNPFIGFILDYFKRFRLTISVIMLVVAFSHVAMVFIPPKDPELVPRRFPDSDFHARVQHLFVDKNEQQTLFISAYNGSKAANVRFSCHVECSASEPPSVQGNATLCGELLDLEYQAYMSLSEGELKFQVPGGVVLKAENKYYNSFTNSSGDLIIYRYPLMPSRESGVLLPSLVIEKYLSSFNYSTINANKDILDFISAKKFEQENRAFLFLSKLTSTPEAFADWFRTDHPCVLNLDCTTNRCSSDESRIDKVISDEVTIEAEENEYLSVQFWVLFLLITISSQSFSAVMFMMDTVCYEMLQDKKEKYGQQRLWGTVGWGIGALAGGYLNDLVSSDASDIDYAPGFYLLAVISLLDLFIIYHLEVTDLRYSSNIWKDVCLLLTNIDVVYSVLMIYFIGLLSGFLWNYQFWFMEEIGASQTLLGLSQTFECLFELPWFVASGWIIAKIGHSNSNSVALLCFALRFLAFEFMFDPWMTLPAALLHGPTFGLFYASLTMYAKSEAPPGTEATVQSLIHLSFEGIGAATGVIIGGIGFDKVGSRATFSYATRLSFLLLAVNLVMTALFYRFKRKAKSVDITPVDDDEKNATDVMRY